MVIFFWNSARFDHKTMFPDLVHRFVFFQLWSHGIFPWSHTFGACFGEFLCQLFSFSFGWNQPFFFRNAIPHHWKVGVLPHLSGSKLSDFLFATWGEVHNVLIKKKRWVGMWSFVLRMKVIHPETAVGGVCVSSSWLVIPAFTAKDAFWRFFPGWISPEVFLVGRFFAPNLQVWCWRVST